MSRAINFIKNNKGGYFSLKICLSDTIIKTYMTKIHHTRRLP